MYFTGYIPDKPSMEDQTYTYPYDFPLLQSKDSSRAGSPLLDENVLKFEDAQDCAGDKLTSDKSEEILGSSEEEKQLIRKNRKPRIKLGVKISKENVVDPEVVLVPPKRSWNIVAGSKPKEMFMGLELPDIESVEKFSIKLPPQKENLVDFGENLVLNEVKDDFNLIKMEKSVDENGSSPADATESDDSSKVLPIINLDTENVASEQNVQTAAKASKKKTKKKKK